MFEQSFKNIDDVLWKDAGVSNELDYIEQTSWILFLKYLDDLEQIKKTEAALAGKKYEFIIDQKYSWGVWAEPKTTEGKLDHNKALSGDDLKDFVDQKLFPYLKRFKTEADSPDTIEYKIGEIFSELKNKIQSGYTLRNILDIVDEMHFRTDNEKHELSHLYEAKIKNMGNAGRNGGEYYTPRPLIRTIVKVVAPKISDKIYDGACGSAGFLVESFDYLQNSKNLSTAESIKLQKNTFYGKEKKSLAYIIGVMNMILHGIEAPNIIHTNTLATNLADIQEKDRYDVVLANPPFGGKERSEVQQNFPIKTGETAFLFLQHFIKILKTGGKAGIVIKNTFLSNGDATSLRRLLLESCNLHTVLDLPGGAFQGAGVKTVVLFFEKGKSTKRVWYYQLNLERNLGKTTPLSEKDLAEFVELQKTKANSKNSWSVNISDINQETFDLSVKNPNGGGETVLRDPREILKAMKKLDKESEDILDNILSKSTESNWPIKKLSEVILDIKDGGTPSRKNPEYFGGDIYWCIVKDIKPQIYDTKEKLTRIGLEHCSAKVWPVDSIIISLGATIGQIGIAKVPTATKQGLSGIVVNKKVITPEFLFYILNYKKEYIQKLATGATIKEIRPVKLKELLTFPLPPLSEQKKIVKTLGEVFEKTAQAKRMAEQKLKDLEELKKSILRKMFNISL